MAQTLKAVVAPPLPEPLPGGLLNSSRRLSGPWQRGVVFTTSACIPGNLYPFCGSDQEKDSGESPEGAAFEAVVTYATVNCSTLGRVDREFAAEALGIQAETQLGLTLATSTTNDSLADGTTVGSGADVVEALALLENELADILGNVKGTVHVSPQVLTLLYAGGAVIQNLNGGYSTPNGHVLIASAGYVDLDGIHGTGPVFANHEVVEVFSDVERSQNTLTVRAEGIGIVAFDPCANIHVTIGGS